MTGSSETTREAFCFDLYRIMKPQHKKRIRKAFLEWFVGFSEGDGTFSVWFDGRKKRAAFVIDQKDPKVLHYIRTELGFGKVSQLKRGYWRYSVYDNDNLIKLYCLFAGNLVLNKRNLAFERWSTYLQFPEYFSISKKYLQHIQDNKRSGVKAINCKNGWLAGFWDADGGFYAYADYTKKIPNIVLRAYVTQAAEIEVLQQIAIAMNAPNKVISTITNNVSPKRYNRLDLADDNSIVTALSYFQKYKLIGPKNIVFGRWKRLYQVRENMKVMRSSGIEISEKSIKKLKRLIESTKRNKMMI